MQAEAKWRMLRPKPKKQNTYTQNHKLKIKQDKTLQNKTLNIPKLAVWDWADLLNEKVY